jgi:hypothetical protein
MAYKIHPDKLGVIVMKTETEMDPVATQAIRDKSRVKVEKVKNVYSFRPILTLTIDTPRFMRDKLVVVARFHYKKDGRSLLTYDFRKEFAKDLILHPSVVPDLSPYNGNLLGSWEVETFLSLVPEREMKVAIENRRRDFLRTLDYQRLASFQWEVVENDYMEITETGQLRTPAKKQRANVPVDVHSI